MQGRSAAPSARTPDRRRKARWAVLAGLAALVLAALSVAGPAARAQPDDRYLFLTVPDPRLQRTAPPPRAARPQRPPAATTVVVRDTPGKLDIEPAAQVYVLGDTMAELLAGGLGEAFAEGSGVRVLRRTVGPSGLVRSDYFDWRQSLPALLASGEKITHAVLMIGSNDRQPMRVGGETLEPFSEAWRAAYAARVDEIARAFAEKGVPLYWVGLPIMENDRFAADMAVLNGLFRQAARRHGATFIDLWEPFADAAGRYTSTGPDLNGDIVRLRTADGVNFSRLGARKAAHFVEVEIRRGLPGEPGTSEAPAVIAVPADDVDPASVDPALQPGGIERAIDEAVRRGMEGLPPLPVAIPQRPPSGPILPLTGPERSPGGQLASSPAAVRAPGQGEAGLLVERVLVQGRPPDPRPGRADDFSWPAPPR